MQVADILQLFSETDSRIDPAQIPQLWLPTIAARFPPWANTTIFSMSAVFQGVRCFVKPAAAQLITKVIEDKEWKSSENSILALGERCERRWWSFTN